VRRVGEVVRVAQGLAIVRPPVGTDADGPPDIGTVVVDQQLDRAGRIVDVFGPVSRPYLAVSTADSPAALLGVVLYARS
jgi:RNA-binding protein